MICSFCCCAACQNGLRRSISEMHFACCLDVEQPGSKLTELAASQLVSPLSSPPVFILAVSAARCLFGFKVALSFCGHLMKNTRKGELGPVTVTCPDFSGVVGTGQYRFEWSRPVSVCPSRVTQTFTDPYQLDVSLCDDACWYLAWGLNLRAVVCGIF